MIVCSVSSMIFTANAVVTDTASVSASYGLASNIQDGVILHCFNWKYNDIKNDLANIAKAGFTSVQTSPAQPDAWGTWYWLYQPKGFYIGSNGLGSKSELQALCTEADKYGIKVIVDVVANHLSGDHGSIQNDLRDGQYWHNMGGVGNWKDRYQVTHGDIGMPDLCTENSYVQQVVTNYVKELKSVGVDGIRWDAAKHIGLPSEGDNFFKSVTTQGLYNYGEILVGPDDRDSGNEALMKEYTNYISVTDSDYGKELRDSFNSGSVPASNGKWCNKGIADNKLVYWGESHDTWSNNKDYGFSNEMSQNVIDRAYAVAAARGGATSLYFSRPSSPNKEDIKIGSKGSTHYTSAEVSAVNKFHNAMIGQREYYQSSNGCAVVSREKGAVVVKGSSSGYVSVANAGGLTAPGTYKDQVSGNTFTVTSSTISGEIGSSGIAVLYNPGSVVTPATTAPTQAPTNPPQTSTGKLGDADLDGKITIADATTVQLALAKLIRPTNEQKLRGDVNGSGALEIMDATYIQLYLAKTRVPYKIGYPISGGVVPATVAPTSAPATTAPSSGTVTLKFTKPEYWQGTPVARCFENDYNNRRDYTMTSIGGNTYSVNVDSSYTKVEFRSGDGVTWTQWYDIKDGNSYSG